MKPKIFIDGQEGTTGLEIYQRLDPREDICLLHIAPDKRKDDEERKRLLNEADLVFLCLPDEAARQAVSWIENPATKVLDPSTAHRTAPGWVYGFPELHGKRTAISASKRVANPGCHATGFLAAAAPLVELGLIAPGAALSAYSLTGYSGGGKKLIAEYEDAHRDPRHESHRIYGLDLSHKHLPEMAAVAGLARPPLFHPILGDFYRGMATTLFLPDLDARRIWEALTDYYAKEALVTVAPLGGAEPVLYADTLAGRDSLELVVCGNGEKATVTALFDNLGKGASGAAVQNMNLMLGLEERTGLTR